MQKRLYTVLLLLLLCFNAQLYATDTFEEELLIRSLEDGRKILSHFQFTTTTILDDDVDSNFDLFPKSMGQTISKFGVEEMHLSFTQGRWWSERWGKYPIIASPVGVELWAAFNSQSDVNGTLEGQWKGLVGTLSGMFCASLGQMGVTVTGQPQYSFKSHATSNSVLYSALPREAVCTENLTPWIKMLPCRSKGGLATLLNAMTLYDVSYHSMGIHVRKNCYADCKLEFIQTLTVVFDQLKHKSSADWTLQSLFKRDSVTACPLASKSKVLVELTDGIKVSPSGSSDSSLAIYDLTTLERPLSLSITTSSSPPSNPPEVSVQRYFTGYGQEFGGIAVHLFNKGNTSIDVTYYELIPWYLRVYLHTFSIFIDNVQHTMEEAFDSFSLKPAEERGSPTTIEFTITLPPQSTTYFTIQFEKAFLHWTEHPPDAHRGFDIGSAVVTVKFPTDKPLKFNGLDWSPSSKQSQSDRTIRLYTEGLLVSLPTPDFSMPYNVITLTGTIFALFFGSTLNVLIRRMKNLERIKDDFVSNRPIAKIFRKLLSFIDDDDQQ